MALATIFCPQCDTLLLDAAECSGCHWHRPTATAELGQPNWAVALGVKLPRREVRPVAQDGYVCIPTEKGIVAFNSGETEGDPGIKWRYQLDSSYCCHGVAVWDEYLLPGTEYTGGFPAPRGELVVLSARSGEEVWRYGVDGVSVSVPTIDHNIAFVTVNSGWLYAIDLTARQELWRHKIDSPWSWAPSAPLLTPTGLLILPSRSKGLIALDMASKDPAWTFPAAGWFPHTPVLAGEAIYVRCWDRHLYAIDVTDGHEIWWYKAPRDFSSDAWASETYLYIGVKDYCSGAEAGERAYALYTLDRQSGELISRYEVNGHIYARPVATAEVVFFATDDRNQQLESQGTFYALDPCGREPIWEPFVAEQRFQSDLLLVNDRVIAGTRQGAIYAFPWQAVESSPEKPQLYLERGEWENAAIAHALAGEFLQAAEIYASQLGQLNRAGQLFLQAREYRRVIELLGQSEQKNERDLAITAAQSLPKVGEKARALKKLGDHLSAARAFEEAADWSQAGDCYREAQEWEKARAAYARAQAWDKWTALTRELKLWRDLVQHFLEAGEYAQAGDECSKHGAFLEAATHYAQAGLPARAFQAYRHVALEKMTDGARRRLAELAEELGELEVAIVDLATRDVPHLGRKSSTLAGSQAKRVDGSEMFEL